MLKRVVITNNLGESVECKIVGVEAENSSGLIIASITGLGPVKANINMTDLPTSNGAIYNSSRLTNRNIGITAIFTNANSIEESRLLSYKYFPVNEKITIEVETDNRTASATGYVESNEPAIFSLGCGCVVSILCESSFFFGEMDEVDFIPIIDTSGVDNNGYADIYYQGDKNDGVAISFKAELPMEDISISMMDEFNNDVDGISLDFTKMFRIVPDTSPTNVPQDQVSFLYNDHGFPSESQSYTKYYDYLGKVDLPAMVLPGTFDRDVYSVSNVFALEEDGITSMHMFIIDTERTHKTVTSDTCFYMKHYYFDESIWSWVALTPIELPIPTEYKNDPNYQYFDLEPLVIFKDGSDVYVVSTISSRSIDLLQDDVDDILFYKFSNSQPNSNNIANIDFKISRAASGAYSIHHYGELIGNKFYILCDTEADRDKLYMSTVTKGTDSWVWGTPTLVKSSSRSNGVYYRQHDLLYDNQNVKFVKAGQYLHLFIGNPSGEPDDESVAYLFINPSTSNIWTDGMILDYDFVQEYHDNFDINALHDSNIFEGTTGPTDTHLRLLIHGIMFSLLFDRVSVDFSLDVENIFDNGTIYFYRNYPAFKHVCRYKNMFCLVGKTYVQDSGQEYSEPANNDKIYRHDSVEIDTRSGQKHITLTRYGIQYPILCTLNKNPNWIKLRRGYNRISYTVSNSSVGVTSRLSNAELIYQNQYEGM